jgi:hypothetical protein
MPLLFAVDPYKTFSTLSFRDLVEARDFYHSQLMRKQNVVGTALGRYLQRKTGVSKAVAKTLSNTEVRNNSWPCLLVFVRKWAADSHFGSGKDQIKPGNFIPPSIEMSDGRVVPLCVIEAPPVEAQKAQPVNPVFPNNWIGGGYPMIADVQNQEHVASIGGMFTDGHLIYAITNHHVTGAPGEVVYSLIGGERVPIGTSSRKQLTRMPFERVYPSWPGKNVFVHMDIGLIEVEDVTRWTSQIYGIGCTGHMVDLNTDNLSLRLIDCPLRAFGCATGQMHGRVLGMFYRYKAVSGSEYIADFIIGPDGKKPFSTHHGDSGTLWLLDTEDEEMGLMPLAIQWGGQVLADGDGEMLQQPFALATNLSTVCRELDVDFVQDWNVGQFEYWGAVGHYTIASIACNIVQNPQLRGLMQANADSITFPTAQITAKNMKGLSKADFVPLADVPDMVWKVGQYKRGGMTSPEHANHFADMDKPDSNGKTLLQLCEQSKANIDPTVWMKYYTDPKVKDESKGLLPFRCWQIYNEMVSAVKAGDVTRFVCAAGILSHYVGDACQPLHISYMFNGDPAHTETVQVTKKGVTTSVVQPVAKGVHSAYEDGLVNFHSTEIVSSLQSRFKGKSHGESLNKDHGFGAAEAVVNLMQQTFKAIQPAQIVKAYVPIKKLKPKDVADHLWSQFGSATVNVMADGARTLSMLWDSAWKEGGGTASMAGKGKISQAALKKLYIQPKFLESFTLAQIQPVLTGKGTVISVAGKRRGAGKKASSSHPNLKTASAARKRPPQKVRKVSAAA